jgi:type IX secretion system PorP/SprF family membrane protein
MIVKSTYFVLFLILLSGSVFAQQLPVYQHSFLIRSAYNPAEVLNERNEISIFALRGNQFQKFQGGFINNYANFSTPLENLNVGLGLDMASRSYGPITQLSVGFAYAYRVKFDKNYALVLGTRIGFMEHRFNKSLINPLHENDFIIDAIPDGVILPNGNVGITFHTPMGAVELAVPQLISNRFLNTSAADVQSITLQPHLFTRYSIDIEAVRDQVRLTPIVSMRYLPGTIPQFEAGLTATFKNSLWINANYKSAYSLSIGVGVKANDKWTIGYSYDKPIINRYSFNANNHEIVLGYTFERGKPQKPQIEWNQANNTQKVRMDSVSSIQDVTMAEEFLRNKLASKQKADSLLAFNDSLTRSTNSNYKSVTVQINMVDSLFESIVARTNSKGFSSNSKSNNDFRPEKLSQSKLEEKSRQIKEDEYIEKLNKGTENKIKIVRNEQPSEKYFVELSGDESPGGYYLITGVFSTLERAQNFRWKSDSATAKIIYNNKNQYFYVVYSYSATKSVAEIEPILNDFKSKNQKIWILDY